MGRLPWLVCHNPRCPSVYPTDHSHSPSKTGGQLKHPYDVPASTWLCHLCLLTGVATGCQLHIVSSIRMHGSAAGCLTGPLRYLAYQAEEAGNR